MTQVSFGERLRSHRLDAAFTQEDLAHRAGLSAQAIGALERGDRRYPYRDTVARIAKALSLSDEHRDELFRMARRRGQPAPSQGAPSQRVSDAWHTPRQLPAGETSFVGRAKEVQRSIHILSQDTAVAPSLCISGMGGVGKSSLALDVAHRICRNFPDGSVHIDLHGFSAIDALSPLEIVSRALRATGIPADQIPESLEEASAQLRTHLHQRRVLIVLDNAADPAQFAPFLQVVGPVAVIVTSRKRFTEFAQARTVELGVMSTADAIDLLAKTSERPVDNVSSRGGTELVTLCGHLPLALTIAGRRLAARPHWPVTALLEHLQGEHNRLRGLADANIDVRASLTLSTQELSSREDHVGVSATRAFMLTCAIDFEDATAAMLAAVCDVPIDRAFDMMERLVDLNLLESRQFGRYRAHDLVVLLGRELGAERLTVAERQSAITRALEHYVDMAWHASAVFEPANARQSLRPLPKVAKPSMVSTAAEARDWFEREIPNVRLLMAQAQEIAPSAVADVAAGLSTYFLANERTSTWAAILEHALTVAPPGKIHAMLNADLGVAHAQLGHSDSALRYLNMSKVEFLAHKQNRFVSLVTLNAGNVLRRMGRADDAAEYASEALHINRQIDDARGQSKALFLLGSLHRDREEYDSALECHEEALALRRTTMDERGIAITLGSIGLTRVELGMHAQGVANLQESAQKLHALGDRMAEARVLDDLGCALLLGGSAQDAVRVHHEALQIAVERSDPWLEQQITEHLDKAQAACDADTPSEPPHRPAVSPADG
ncbi:XRE family transcriptional regulator [Luteipulveratus mongoliensis]|uniref:HTH cro/C1-type domain-containing protein n=1 Tax=Luteipulveratus mongoliensis TaxID=571913 RepID=A0A0K1JM49_9MICO|nr:XRE family transcriptional regulator [Luteipulveratus mongoliensis]AKU17665.1 hypothetical protein VV02_20480 [Luteipulveratus mongoliensis]